jgi:hypothetical protein
MTDSLARFPKQFLSMTRTHELQEFHPTLPLAARWRSRQFRDDHFGKSLSLMYREVGVKRMPRGLRQVARSISRLSPIESRPETFLAIKIASLILRPDRGFLVLTCFQRLSLPSLSFGSSSLISRFRQSFALSRGRLRPPGNIHSPSRRRLTSRTRPRFVATSLDDLAISVTLEVLRSKISSCVSRACQDHSILPSARSCVNVYLYR